MRQLRSLFPFDRAIVHNDSKGVLHEGALLVATPPEQWHYGVSIEALPDWLKVRSPSGEHLIVEIEVLVQSGELGIGLVGHDLTTYLDEQVVRQSGHAVLTLFAEDLDQVSHLVVRNAWSVGRRSGLVLIAIRTFAVPRLPIGEPHPPLVEDPALPLGDAVVHGGTRLIRCGIGSVIVTPRDQWVYAVSIPFHPERVGAGDSAAVGMVTVEAVVHQGNIGVGWFGTDETYMGEMHRSPDETVQVYRLRVPSVSAPAKLVIRKTCDRSERGLLLLRSVRFTAIQPPPDQRRAPVPRPKDLSAAFSLREAVAYNAAVVAWRGSRLVAVTPPEQWYNAIALPLRLDCLPDPADAFRPARVLIDATVERGRIHIGAFAMDGCSFVAGDTFSRTDRAVRYDLFLPRLADCRELIVRNAEEGNQASVVSISSITVQALDPHAPASEQSDTLYVFYDLGLLPISFDFLVFLSAAEVRRAELRLASMHVVFIPGAHDGDRALEEEYDRVIDRVSRQWRLHNILVPLVGCFPTVSGYTVASSRLNALLQQTAVAHAFPNAEEVAFRELHTIYQFLIPRWSHRLPILPPRATAQGLRYVQQWIERMAGGRKLVTITVRQYDFQKARNTNLKEWVAFARGLNPKVYFPVFVPDTDRALETPAPELAGMCLFTEPCFNLGLRIALYELSYISLFTSGGPSFLSIMNERCRYLFIKIIVPGAPETASEPVARRLGLVPGETPFKLTPYQKWVWEDDTYDVILREFTAMARLIDSGGRGGDVVTVELPCLVKEDELSVEPHTNRL